MVTCCRCDSQRRTNAGPGRTTFYTRPAEEEEEESLGLWGGGGWCESRGQVQLVSKDNGAIWVEGNPTRNARTRHQRTIAKIFLVNGDTIRIIRLGSGGPQLKNIAKGTTDPRVEFLSQVLEHILIKFQFLES